MSGIVDLTFPTGGENPDDLYSYFLAYKHTHGGKRFAGVVPLTYGRARIVVGEVPPSGYLDMW